MREKGGRNGDLQSLQTRILSYGIQRTRARGGGERNGGSDGQVGADYGELEDGVISVRLRLIPDRGTDTRKRPDVTGGCLSDDVTH